MALDRFEEWKKKCPWHVDSGGAHVCTDGVIHLNDAESVKRWADNLEALARWLRERPAG